MTLGENIKKERERLGISQAKPGEYVSKSQQAVGKWEKDIAEPDTKTIDLLAKLFGVSVDYLLGISDQQTPSQSPRIALYEGEVSEEGMEDIERFVEFIKEREKKK